MRILVLGAGAIGGYFGGRLVEGGADATFLVRPGRRAVLERDGLRIESPKGNAQLRVKTTTAAEVTASFELVLLTCKAYDLEVAVDDIAPAMKGDCAVLPLLNGMSHYDLLDERFGRERVIGGTCAINSTVRSDGVVVHTGAVQRVAFGERDGSKSGRTEALAGLMKNTKLDWVLTDAIKQELWEKIVFLSALAATTCLFRANIGEIVGAPAGLEAIERVYAVNCEIASREGHPVRPAAVSFARGILMDPSGKSTASMLRDLEAGHQVESDHIVGWMLERARVHELDDEVLTMAYTHLKAYENRRKRV